MPITKKTFPLISLSTLTLTSCLMLPNLSFASSKLSLDATIKNSTGKYLNCADIINEGNNVDLSYSDGGISNIPPNTSRTIYATAKHDDGNIHGRIDCFATTADGNKGSQVSTFHINYYKQPHQSVHIVNPFAETNLAIDSNSYYYGDSDNSNTQVSPTSKDHNWNESGGTGHITLSLHAD